MFIAVQCVCTWIIISVLNFLRISFRFNTNYFYIEARILQEAADARLQQCKNVPTPASTNPPTDSLQQEVNIPDIPDRSLMSNITELKQWWKNLELSPDSTFATVWDKFVLAVVFVACTAGLLEAAYSRYEPVIRFENSVWGIIALVVLYLFDIVYLMDIFVSLKKVGTNRFHCGQMEGRGQIRERLYVRSVYFVLDVLAVLPLDLLALGWANVDARWMMLTYLRLNRVIKFYKVKNVCFCILLSCVCRMIVVLLL